jgi:hypothetical protein
MERSEIRGHATRPVPDVASLHPGYDTVIAPPSAVIARLDRAIQLFAKKKCWITRFRG